MAQIQSLSHRHDAIIDWLIGNPDRTLGECAAFFGFTQAWLSQVIHSDVFQMVYRQRAAERGALVTHTIASRMMGMGALGVETLLEKMEAGKLTERGLIDATKLALQATGYLSGDSVGNTVEYHQHLHVDASELKEARERILQQRAGTTQGKVSGQEVAGSGSQSG